MLSGAPMRRATWRRPSRGGARSTSPLPRPAHSRRGSSSSSSSRTETISDSSSSSTTTTTTTTTSTDHTCRRALLLAAATSGLLRTSGPAAAVAAAADNTSAPAAAAAATLNLDPLLASVLTDGDVVQPGAPPPWAPRQALLPRWLFGEWRVRARLAAFRAPLGGRFVPPGMAAAARADLGTTVEYAQRYYSTLPDTFENNARVALGLGIPQDAVTPDRAFNARQTAAAYSGGGAAAVAHVEYDPSAEPLRLTLEWSRLAPDFRPLPPRRAELYIQRIDTADLGPFGVGGDEGDEDDGEVSGSSGSESSGSSAWRPPRGAPTFVWAEQCRQVSLGVRAADVADYSVSTAYALLSPGRVAARQRTAVFLEPRDALYFQARRRAVAVYDYDLELERVPAPEGATACVETPKQVVQCV